MRRYSLIVFVMMTLGPSLPARSASLEEARQLHQAGKTQEALALIETLLGSEVAEETQAGALDLLGSIAVEEGQLPMAKQAWSRLLEEYPDYAASHDISTKLSLVSALVKIDKPPIVPPPVADSEPTPEPTPVASAVPPTIEESVPAPSPESSVPQASPPQSGEALAGSGATAAPPESTAAETRSLVLVAARGKPHDAVRELSDRVVEHLRERGVDAESATGGIPVVTESTMVLPLLLQKGQQDRAGSALLLTADFVSIQKVSLDCYAVGGAKLWKVKTSGGTGWTGRPYTKSGITEELAERFMKKLDEKIGGPGLPITLE